MKDLESAERKVNQDLSTITAEINQLTLPTNHIQSFLEFAEKYKDKLEDVLEDREATYELIHLFLEEIVVESRSLRETDAIGGRKKKRTNVTIYPTSQGKIAPKSSCGTCKKEVRGQFV